MMRVSSFLGKAWKKVAWKKPQQFSCLQKVAFRRRGCEFLINQL
jgi:hypothetical protein